MPEPARVRQPSHVHFSEPPVLSLNALAASPPHVRRDSISRTLIRHLVSRFFENETVSLGGEVSTRLGQLVTALAVPLVIVALFLVPAYLGVPPHPLVRPYWPRVSDHLFYVIYAFVTTGAATVLEWDVLFPDLLDVLILGPLPLPARQLFSAKLLSVSIVLGVFVGATNFVGGVFLCAAADKPGFFHHLFAHLVAVFAAGIFAALLFIAMEAALLAILGVAWFRRIAPLLQALSLCILLMLLFAFPLLSHSVQALVSSQGAVTRWLPPFWFLGLYQVLVDPVVPAAFPPLAKQAGIGLGVLLLVAALCYPLAYQRTWKRTIEGTPAKRRLPWVANWSNRLLHALWLRDSRERGIYHFISQTLLRGPRNRAYLAMYGGIGLALVVSEAFAFVVANGSVRTVFSTWGLLSAVPIVAFWMVSGLRVALASPMHPSASWIFKIIGRQPQPEYVRATWRWVLLRALFVASATAAAGVCLKPAAFHNLQQVLVHIGVAAALAFLLTDVFLVSSLDVPFTVRRWSVPMSLAMILILYLGVFPPYVFVVAGSEDWIRMHLWRTGLVILLVHWVCRRIQQRSLREQSLWQESEDLDTTPGSLGLR